MPKIQDLTGKTFGIWKVINKTHERTKSGCVVYKVKNMINGKIYFKSTWYLKQFVKENSFKTTPGRPRKWIITKVPVKSWKVVRKPYISNK